MYTLIESPSWSDFESFEKGEPPFVSLFLQTHRGSAQTKQDKLTYKNLVSEAERALEKHYSKRDYTDIVANLQSLLENPDEKVWRGLKDGLAVFANGSNFYVCLLDYTVSERSVVANSFHIKPLVKGFQFDTKYYLLEITKEEFNLYSGNAEGFEKVELPEGVEHVFEEAFPEREKEAILNVGSYGGLEASYHGHQSKNDLQAVEREKNFRYTDKIVSAVLADEMRAPVILVTLPQRQAEYQALSSLETLLPKGIDKQMNAASKQEILKEAVALIVEIQKERLAQISEGFEGARANGKASTDPREIAAALVERKVSMLFVDEEVFTPGHFDPQEGTVVVSGDNSGGTDDLGDDFAQATFAQGGSVYALDHLEMPAENGLVAFFRY